MPRRPFAYGTRMPPLPLVLDAITHIVLPAAIASAAVFVLVAVTAPPPARLAAGALALAAGFLAGNHFRGAIEYRIDPDQSLSLRQLGRAAFATVVPPDEAEDAEPTPLAYYWLPWTGGLALFAGFLARMQRRGTVAWLYRLTTVAVTTALAVPPELRSEMPWVVATFAGAILPTWVVLERLAVDETAPRLRLGPAAAGSAAFVGAAVVLLHAHSARLSDVAVILSVSLAVIAVAAFLFRVDPSSVAPGIATSLPSLMISGYYDTFSEVPPAAFAVVAASLLPLSVLLLPRVRKLRGRRWHPLATALAAAPLLTAVGLAMRAESLSFE